MINIASLKTKINNKAKQNNQSPQDLMQMYFFERILYRISISPYKYNFIIKGGLLLSSMFEDESRTMQDMDTMLKGIELTEEKITSVLKEILSINTDDGLSFELLNIRKIREEDLYGGYRVSLKASIASLNVNLKIDITTGDSITPREIEYSYKCIVDDNTIKIMAFSKYTVIAEKFETLIEMLESDTRAKDFYDIYKLMSEKLEEEKIYKAIYNTFKRRNTLNLLDDLDERFVILKESIALKEYWSNYQKKNSFARNVLYDYFLSSIENIIIIINKYWHK